jgi:S1-C subfamily serine protease
MSNVLVELSDALASAAERAGNATVLVNARRRFPASGVVYAADLVLTADHVIERDEDISVTLSDGTEIPAKIAGRDPGSDLALLRLERPVSNVAEAASASPRIGQIALVLGRPTKEGIQASLGVISAVGGPIRTPRGGMLDQYIRTDAISYPGFSGGPTVAADGTILGLNTSGLMGGAPLTIPVGVAWRIADNLDKHGSVRRGYLGIRSQGVEIPSAQQKALGREQSTGLMVVGVEEGSPAEKGGLLMGDVLVGFNGGSVTDHEELFVGLAGDVVDKTASIEILRAGAKQTLNVMIESRPESSEEHHHGEHGHHGGHGHWGRREK